MIRQENGVGTTPALSKRIEDRRLDNSSFENTETGMTRKAAPEARKNVAQREALDNDCNNDIRPVGPKDLIQSSFAPTGLMRLAQPEPSASRWATFFRASGAAGQQPLTRWARFLSGLRRCGELAPIFIIRCERQLMCDCIGNSKSQGFGSGYPFGDFGISNLQCRNRPISDLKYGSPTAPEPRDLL
jgi:hypothetical protein